MKAPSTGISGYAVTCLWIFWGAGCALIHRESANPSWMGYIHETIPITVQRGKPVIFQTRVRRDSNAVAIRCSPSVWRELTNRGLSQGGTEDLKSGEWYHTIGVQLIAQTKEDAELLWIRPGWLLDHPARPAGMAALVPDAQFLFVITGSRRGKATVEIVFPNGPEEPTPAELVVLKVPADMGL